jgi:nucleotide-binding universal stress UspA family protein
MKTILVPIDFSSVTADVIEQATQLAAAFSSAVWLLHVAAPEPEFVGYDSGPRDVRETVAREMHASHRMLQQHSTSLRERGINATAIQVQGATVETIVREAQRLQADIIVLGSHGHGALHRALLGSVSEGVLHHATCPLLILPARRPRAAATD